MWIILLFAQLVNTVDDVLGDVEGLHSKLDRKSKVETANQTTSQELQHVSSAHVRVCLFVSLISVSVRR